MYINLNLPLCRRSRPSQASTFLLPRSFDSSLNYTMELEPKSPKSMQHTFLDPILRAHFAKTPMPPGSGALIDLPPDVFLKTEEEIHVIAACLWVLSVRYDGLSKEERPKKAEDLRKWIVKNRNEVVAKMGAKIEPPFTAWSIDQIQKDIGAMMEELLTKTLPPPEEKEKEQDQPGLAKK